MGIDHSVATRSDQSLLRKPVGDRPDPSSGPGQALEGFLHFSLEVKTTVEDHLRTLQSDEVRRGRLVKVRIDTRPHQPLDNDITPAHSAGQIGHHPHGGDDRKRCAKGLPTAENHAQSHQDSRGHPACKARATESFPNAHGGETSVQRSVQSNTLFYP